MLSNAVAACHMCTQNLKCGKSKLRCSGRVKYTWDFEDFAVPWLLHVKTRIYRLHWVLIMLVASFYSFNAATIEFRIAEVAAIILQLDSSMLAPSEPGVQALIFTLYTRALLSKVNCQRPGDIGYTRLISSRASTLECVLN